MPCKPGEIIAAAIVLTTTYSSWFYYPHLPDRMASHWGMAGQVNGYLPKFWGTALMPLIGTALLILFIVLPRIDPQRENIKNFRAYFDGFIVAIFLFLAYLQFLVITWNLGNHISIIRWMVPALAVLFFAAGTLIAHAELNWTIGIRTPWTLSSATVWRATHALGSRLFYAAAVIALGGWVLPAYAFWFIIIPAISAALVTIVYSYVVYRGESENHHRPAKTTR